MIWLRISSLFSFFAGTVELYSEKKYSDAFLSVVADFGIEATVTSSTENDGIFVKMSPSNAKKIASALDKMGIIVYISNVRGLKNNLLAYKTRVGLLLGALVFTILLSVSTLYVFKIQVNGNSDIDREQLLAELSELGIYPGTRIRQIDKKSIATEILLNHPEIAWASISVKGTTVCVEIKEKASAPIENPSTPELLVARYDGVVKSVAVQSGRSAVGVGSVVKKGDLLICGYISGSGLQYTDNPLLRLDGAKGSVIAEVHGSISVKVPFCENSESYTRRERAATVISALGKEISFGAIPSENFEKTATKYVTVMGIIELPISYVEYYRLETVTESKYLDEERAVALAQHRAYEMLKAELFDAEISEIEQITETDENGATVTLKYTCERDIAEPKFKE